MVILNVAGKGWASLIVIILTLGGLQRVVLDIMGDYIRRIYTKVKQRPYIKLFLKTNNQHI